MGSESFLNLPGAINLSGSLDFSPRRGTIDQHSLKVDLEVDSVHVCVDRLQSVLRMLDDHHQFDPLSPSVEVPPDPTPLNSPTSPMASPTSPMTPMAPLFGAFRSVRFSLLLPHSFSLCINSIGLSTPSFTFSEAELKEQQDLGMVQFVSVLAPINNYSRSHGCRC